MGAEAGGAAQDAPRGWFAKVTSRGRVRPYLVGELLIVVFLVRVYDLIKHVEDRRRSIGLANAERVRDVERALRVSWEHAVDQWVNHQHWLALVTAYWYQFAHESVTLGVLAWVWWSRPWLYRRARNALIVVNVVGLLVFALFPVAPPRLLPGAGIVDSVADAGFGSTHGGIVPADQFAAMPSLHVAWATWTAAVLLLAVRARPVRVFAWLYVPWVTFVVVGTGNHYVLDAVAGLVVAAGSLLVSRAWSLQWVRVLLRRPSRGEVTTAGLDDSAAPDAERLEPGATRTHR